jgi:hypothetical protein
MSGTGRYEFHQVAFVPGLSRSLCLVLLLLLLASTPVSAKVLILNGSATNGTIQDLINSTISGDSIFLAGGTYEGNILIDRPIVFGALDENDPPKILADDSRAAITLAVDGITIQGLDITGNARTGLLVQSNNNRISALTISGFENAIELRSATNSIFSGNTLVNNSIGVLSDRQSWSNIFYLNRFDNNGDLSGPSSENIWFSGQQDYQYGGKEYSGALGNSWERYTGTDSNGDGIGDTAYTLQSLQAAPAAAPAGTENADQAPLVSSIGSYTLVRSTNATAFPHGMQPGNPPTFTEAGPSPNSFVSPSVGGQQPDTDMPQTGGPGIPGTPPMETFPGILVQYWWVIPILIAISAITGIWYERSKKRRLLPEEEDRLRTVSPRNATLVNLPGQTLPAESPKQDHPYFTVHLPPLLEKRYPEAEYLGEGGVGRVFRAWDADENRAVAIKVPVRFDEVTGAQFTKELHIWQGLHHKNIVEVYAANVFPMPYIEMEYVESSLATRRFPLEPEEAVKIVMGIAEGLQYAHDRGIVHRDIKPENILLDSDGTPKITDWGLAKALADTKHTGIISFSLSYAAPEQLAPNIYGDAGKWTDIYQLGVLFYEMVTGRLPFEGSGMGEVTHAILHTTPQSPDVTGKNADLIRKIILKCIQKKPEDRYRDVSEIFEELQGLDPGA